jgi:ferredoxin-NADP reductase
VLLRIPLTESGKSAVRTCVSMPKVFKSFAAATWLAGLLVCDRTWATLVNKYHVHLVRQESVALQTATFYFERPAEFSFTAGQFIEVTLPPANVAESDRVHTFSVSSAPYEDCIAITTRLRDSPFKRTLDLLQPGDAVEVEGPYGEFVVTQETPRPIAFLVGGVGITPAFSILKQAARDGRLTGSYLFYSNRARAETPFLAELAQLDAENPEFHLIATMTADPSWMGEKARISTEMIRNYVDPAVAAFYISGPPNMVTAMRDMLARDGVPRVQVRFESFSGY